MSAQTLGEKRIGTNLDYTEDDLGDILKNRAAVLINKIDSIPLRSSFSLGASDDFTNDEIKRLKALAMTCIQEAEMWAQKALALSDERN